MTLRDEERERLLADPRVQELIELRKRELAEVVARGFTPAEVQRAWRHQRERDCGETQE